MKDRIRVTARVAEDDSLMGECSYISTYALSYGSCKTSGSYGEIDGQNLLYSYAVAAATIQEPSHARGSGSCQDQAAVGVSALNAGDGRKWAATPGSWSHTTSGCQ
jgi:hypothetical protein